MRRRLKDHFRYHLKQRGALLAKGRLLARSSSPCSEDGLYFELARHANAMATRLADGLRAAVAAFLTEPVTNQVFPILTDAPDRRAARTLRFPRLGRAWTRAHSAIRLVTSWATAGRGRGRCSWPTSPRCHPEQAVRGA